MNESFMMPPPDVLLPPSPNWFGSHIADLAPEHSLYVYAAHNSVVLLDTSTQSVLAVLAAHFNRVTALALARLGEGQLALVTGSADRTLKLWSLDSWRCLRTLSKRPADTTAIAACHGGGIAVIGDRSGNLFVWDLLRSTKAAKLVCSRAGAAVGCLAPGPGGQARSLVAVGWADGSVAVIDHHRDTVLQRLRSHHGEVHCLRWACFPGGEERHPAGTSGGTSKAAGASGAAAGATGVEAGPAAAEEGPPPPPPGPAAIEEVPPPVPPLPSPAAAAVASQQEPVAREEVATPARVAGTAAHADALPLLPDPAEEEGVQAATLPLADTASTGTEGPDGVPPPTPPLPLPLLSPTPHPAAMLNGMAASSESGPRGSGQAAASLPSRDAADLALPTGGPDNQLLVSSGADGGFQVYSVTVRAPGSAAAPAPAAAAAPPPPPPGPAATAAATEPAGEHEAADRLPSPDAALGWVGTADTAAVQADAGSSSDSRLAIKLTASHLCSLQLPKPQGGLTQSQQSRVWLTTAWVPAGESSSGGSAEPGRRPQSAWLLSSGHGSSMLAWQVPVPGANEATPRAHGRPLPPVRLPVLHARTIFTIHAAALSPQPGPGGGGSSGSGSSMGEQLPELQLLTTSMDRTVKLWQAPLPGPASGSEQQPAGSWREGKEVQAVWAKAKVVWSVAGLGGFVYSLSLWQQQQQHAQPQPQEHGCAGGAQQLLALACGDKTVRLLPLLGLRPKHGQQAVLWGGLTGMPTAVAMLPQWLASCSRSTSCSSMTEPPPLAFGCKDGSVGLMLTHKSQSIVLPVKHKGSVLDLRWGAGAAGGATAPALWSLSADGALLQWGPWPEVGDLFPAAKAGSPGVAASPAARQQQSQMQPADLGATLAAAAGAQGLNAGQISAFDAAGAAADPPTTAGPQLLAVGHTGGSVQLFCWRCDPGDWELHWSHMPSAGGGGAAAVAHVRLCPGADSLAWADEARCVRVSHLRPLAAYASLVLPAQPTALAWAPRPPGTSGTSGSSSGSLLAVALADNTVHLVAEWEGELVLVQRLRGHSGVVRALCWLGPRTLLSGAEDQTVRRWEVQADVAEAAAAEWAAQARAAPGAAGEARASAQASAAAATVAALWAAAGGEESGQAVVGEQEAVESGAAGAAAAAPVAADQAPALVGEEGGSGAAVTNKAVQPAAAAQQEEGSVPSAATAESAAAVASPTPEPQPHGAVASADGLAPGGASGVVGGVGAAPASTPVADAAAAHEVAGPAGAELAEAAGWGAAEASPATEGAVAEQESPASVCSPSGSRASPLPTSGSSSGAAGPAGAEGRRKAAGTLGARPLLHSVAVAVDDAERQAAAQEACLRLAQLLLASQHSSHGSSTPTPTMALADSQLLECAPDPLSASQLLAAAASAAAAAAAVGSAQARHLAAQRSAAMSLWRGDLGQAIDSLLQQGALTADFLSLAAAGVPGSSGGPPIWQALARLHAASLEGQQELHLAALHLLSVGDAESAVRVYQRGGLVREAVLLASARLLPSAPLLQGLRRQHAAQLASKAQAEQAAAQLLAAGQWAQAAAVLLGRGTQAAAWAAARLCKEVVVATEVGALELSVEEGAALQQSLEEAVGRLSTAATEEAQPPPPPPASALELGESGMPLPAPAHLAAQRAQSTTRKRYSPAVQLAIRQQSSSHTPQPLALPPELRQANEQQAAGPSAAAAQRYSPAQLLELRSAASPRTLDLPPELQAQSIAV